MARGKGDLSTVAAVALALVALSIILLNVALTGREVAEFEWEAAAEHLAVEVIADEPTDNLLVNVTNDGTVEVLIVALWVTNGTHSARHSAQELEGTDVIPLLPGQRYGVILPSLSSGSYNVVVVVTSRGNKFSDGTLL